MVNDDNIRLLGLVVAQFTNKYVEFSIHHMHDCFKELLYHERKPKGY